MRGSLLSAVGAAGCGVASTSGRVAVGGGAVGSAVGARVAGTVLASCTVGDSAAVATAVAVGSGAAVDVVVASGTNSSRTGVSVRVGSGVSVGASVAVGVRTCAAQMSANDRLGSSETESVIALNFQTQACTSPGFAICPPRLDLKTASSFGRVSSRSNTGSSGRICAPAVTAFGREAAAARCRSCRYRPRHSRSR